MFVLFCTYVRTDGRTPSQEIMNHFSSLCFGWCLGRGSIVEYLKLYSGTTYYRYHKSLKLKYVFMQLNKVRLQLIMAITAVQMKVAANANQEGVEPILHWNSWTNWRNYLMRLTTQMHSWERNLVRGWDSVRLEYRYIIDPLIIKAGSDHCFHRLSI